MARLANHCDMEQPLPIPTLIAARQALAEQQIRALREWLGEDHELLARRATTPSRPPVSPTARPVSRAPIAQAVAA